MTSPAVDTDVLIVGAGLSGIGMARHVQHRMPELTYTILESRDAIGGTWDLFKYPGIRSDSDMYTLGYRFKPWTGEKAIADGADILRYVREAATEAGIDRHIRFGHRVTGADYASADAVWTVTAQRADGETVTLTARFLLCCGGYYRYDEGYTPQFPGRERFAGTIIHPQHWPDDLDYRGKRVAIIGSGATAVTLAPSMADDAAHVTMVQRSPTYIISQPARDPLVMKLRGKLPARVLYPIVRAKNVFSATMMYQLCRRYPDRMRKVLRGFQERWLPQGYDIDTHFTPRYNPWQERLCVAPNNDFFRAIRKGTVSVSTGAIETFTEDGLTLVTGEHVPADIIITATGLNLQAFGAVAMRVDGKPVELPETMAYKGIMLSGVPNYAYVIGYTNASWTLKADLASEYVCRLLRYMRDGGYAEVVPRADPNVRTEPFMDLSSGYITRSVDSLPKQGATAPWRLKQNYAYDLLALRYGKLVDRTLRFRALRPVTATVRSEVA